MTDSVRSSLRGSGGTADWLSELDESVGGIRDQGKAAGGGRVRIDSRNAREELAYRGIVMLSLDAAAMAVQATKSCSNSTPSNSARSTSGWSSID